MLGILGRKIGMTQVFGKDGEVIPVTVIEAGPCYIVQKKTKEKDGYNAIQLGFGKAKKVSQPKAGHLKKAGLKETLKFLRELRVDKIEEYKPGQEIKVDIFKPGERVNITGVSIGKGFAGTVKRWKFSRGPMTHGSKSHRLPGSIGAGTSPGRVFKGTKMSGRLGGERVTVKNLKVVEVDPARNLILVRGAVPGAKNSFLMIKR